MTHEQIDQRPIRKGVEETLSEYRLLSQKFEDPPKVTRALPPEEAFSNGIGARDIAVTFAVQCYAPGIARMKERRDPKSEAIADSTLDAAHHTTRQHTHYTFLIEGASRSVVHDVFHSYPFYNSEQQSQRYVEAKRGNYLVPKDLTPEQQAFYLEAAEYSNQAYFSLLERLKPEIERRLREMYPKNGWQVAETSARLKDKANKLGQEVARYVLPIAQKTTLYHTLSEIDVLRLFRASRSPKFSDEARFVIGQMVGEIAKDDPTILLELDQPLPERPQNEIQTEYVAKGHQEFDANLGDKQSTLVDIPENARETLARAVRNVLGTSTVYLSDEAALKELLNPKTNALLADIYETGMLDPLTSTLREVHVTFATKLSHTADSQRQRHRRTPGATPPIEMVYDGKPDYVTPLVIRENEDLKSDYDQIMAKVYQNVETAVAMGIPKKYALMLLPNAQTIRLYEGGDLFDWFHRYKQRLCYLAQEEIFFISVEQVEPILDVLPEMAPMLLAPCGLRSEAGIKPRCPEGKRWCGKPVFNWQIEEYKAQRLV